MRDVRSEELTGRLLLVGLVGAVVLIADLVTKAIAGNVWAADPLIVIPSVLTFTYIENFGASFDLFEGAGTFLAIAAIVAIAVVFTAARTARPLGELVGYGLIGGGAAGNLVDRIARGEGLFDGGVIDWIQFPNFPVFNIADSAVNIGVGLLLLVAWRTR